MYKTWHSEKEEVFAKSINECARVGNQQHVATTKRDDVLACKQEIVWRNKYRGESRSTGR